MPDYLNFIPLFQEDSTTVRARVDDDANAGLDPSDEANIDTREGSFYYDVTQPLTYEFARLWDALGTEVPAAASPAMAWGDFLDAWAEVMLPDAPRKVAVSATGTAIFTGAQNVAIGEGTQVAPMPASPTDDPPVFQTTDQGTTSAGVAPPSTAAAVVRTMAAPANLAAVLAAGASTLAVGTYYYRVTALNAVGETVGSNEVSLTITATQHANLTWNAVAGAASYRVYRGTVTGNETGYIAVGSASTSLADTGATALTTATVPTLNTALTDLGSLPANSYYYKVTALSGYGETLPTREVGPIVLPTTGAVYVNWTAVAGAVGYRIYRAIAAGYETQLEIPDLETSGAASYLDDGSALPTTTLPPDTDSSAGVELPIAAISADSLGNIATGAITQILTPIAGIDAVTNDLPTQGGSDPEDDEALRSRVLASFTGQGSGTVTDYQNWALAYPGVGQAYISPLFNGPGTVQVSVLTAQGQPVSTDVLAGLQAQLDPVAGQGHGQAPIGAHVTVTTPTLTAVPVTATATYQSGYSADGASSTVALRAPLAAALQTYFATLGVSSTVVRDHVFAQFFTVEGVLDVVLSAPAADVTTDNAHIPVLGKFTLDGS